MVSDQLRKALNSHVRAGSSYYAVAKAVGVSPQIVSRFAKAERTQIRSATIDAMAEFFGLELAPKKPRRGK